MGTPRFFSRVYSAVGGVLALSAESLERELKAVTVGICLDRSWSEDTNSIQIADLIVNLCSRLYGELRLEGPDAWVERASALARQINPSVGTSQTTEPTLSIVVGNRLWQPDSIFVRSDGWVARVLNSPLGSPPGPTNIIAGAAAASLAVAELFRRAFPSHVPPLPFKGTNVSLLDYSDNSGAQDALLRASIGDITLVGVGAVANAAVWCLSRLEALEGTVTLIDGERVDESNLQRYLLALDADVGASKTELAATALRRTGVRTTAIATFLEETVEAHRHEVVAVSVDNVETRRAVQALLPRIAINGWTSERGLGVSWHDFGTDVACLACAYHPRGDAPSQWQLIANAFGMSVLRVGELWLSEKGVQSSDLDTIALRLQTTRASLQPWLGKPIQDLYSGIACGAIALDFSGIGRLEAVPLAHQSALAGILMAAELVKRTDKGLCQRSGSSRMTIWDDVLHPAPRIWTQRRERISGCICGDPVYQQRYIKKWSINPEGSGYLAHA